MSDHKKKQEPHKKAPAVGLDHAASFITVQRYDIFHKLHNIHNL